MTTCTNGTTMMDDNNSTRTFCEALHDENDIFTAALARCPISWIHDNYKDDICRGPSFNGSEIIKVFHNIPRFGKSNNISTITHDNCTQWKDYKRGLMALSIFIWVFFILWFLLILYCQYTKRMGWLAGGPPPKPVPTSFYDEPLYNRDLAKYKKHVNRLRYIVLLSGMAIIVLSGLLLGSEFHLLSDAVQSAQNILPPTIELLSEAKNATEAYITKANRTNIADKAFLHTLHTDCPSVNTSSILNNDNNKTAVEMISGTTSIKTLAGSILQDGSSNKGDNIFKKNSSNKTKSTKSTPMLALSVDNNNVNDISIANNALSWQKTEENTTQTNETTTDHRGPFYQDALTNISIFLSKTVDDMMDLEETLSVANEAWFYIASTMMVLINFATLVFMIGVILAWKANQPRLFLHTTNRCMLPFFSILIIMTFLLSTACLIWSELLSDLCTGNPDEQVKKMIDPSRPADEFVDWYLGGCMPEDQPGTIPSLVNQLTPVVLSMLAFGRDYLNTSVPIIEETLANVSHLLVNVSEEESLHPYRYLQEEFSDLVGIQYCTDITQKLQASYETLTIKLFSLLELATDLIPILRCDRLNHIYSRFTYQTACEDGINATALVFLYMFLVSFFGMVIITARASWQHVVMLASDFENLYDNDQNDHFREQFEEYREEQYNRRRPQRRRRRRHRYYSVEPSDQSGTTVGTKHVAETNICC